MDEVPAEDIAGKIVERAVALVRRPVRLRGTTLEVFYVDAKEQLPTQKKLHDGLQEVLQEVLKIDARRLTIIFHTRGETHRLYADFVDKFPHHCDYNVEVNFDGKRKFFCDLCGGAF
jgi:hypothetical protein